MPFIDERFSIRELKGTSAAFAFAWFAFPVTVRNSNGEEILRRFQAFRMRSLQSKYKPSLDSNSYSSHWSPSSKLLWFILGKGAGKFDLGNSNFYLYCLGGLDHCLDFILKNSIFPSSWDICLLVIRKRIAVRTNRHHLRGMCFTQPGLCFKQVRLT